MNRNSGNLIRSAMPELDTLRGIAVLGVLFLHGFEWQYGMLHFSRPAALLLTATQRGSLGVDLFFILSGFLITGILIDSRELPRFYARFYTRRALRILPVYYALLLVLVILHSSSIQFVALSFIYLSNMTGMFGVPSDYGPLWSLAVEEHFYLLWPTIVHRLRKERLAIVCLGIMALVPLLRLVCFDMNWGKGSLGLYTWFVADGLATGSLVAILLRVFESRAAARKLCALFLLCSLGLAIAGAPFGITTRERVLGGALQQTTINLFFAGALLLFLLAGTSDHKKIVNNSVLQFFGYISYGLYLDHMLAFRIYDRFARAFWPTMLPSSYHFGLVVLKFVISGSAAIAVAYLSRRYFEEWFLQWKDRIVWRRASPETLLSSPEVASLSAAS